MHPALSENRFRESEWVAGIVPEALRQQRSRDFQIQSLLNRHFDGAVTTVGELYTVLTKTSLRALPLLLLNTNDDEIAIVTRASARGIRDPGLEYLLAASALSERDYTRAVKHLDTATQLDPGSAELAQYRVVALHLAGEVDRARAEAESLRSRSPEGALPGFWEWIATVDSPEPANSQALSP